MIKLVIKHWLCEKAIEVLFKNIAENFELYSAKNVLSYNVGDHLPSIIIPTTDGDIKFDKSKVVYNDGKNMVIVVFDLDIPLYLIIKNGIVQRATIIESPYEEYFKDE